MKKWTIHIIACSINALAVSGILLVLLHEMIFDTEDFMKDGLMALIIFILIYTVYILADYWGIKLVQRYDRKIPVSFTDKRVVTAILAFHCLVQVGAGFLIAEILNRFFSGVNDSFSSRINVYGLFDLLIIIVFVTGLIIFPSTIILFKAVKKNSMEMKNEIENIGIESPEEN